MRLLAIFVLAAFTLIADTLELKSGEKVEGSFKQADSAGAVIEVAGQRMTFPLEKVRAIYFGAAIQASANTPAMQEALDGLKALRSVTASGVSYRDYSQRVLDAKIKFDRYVSASDASSPERPPMALAMREYEMAAQAWAQKFNSSPGDSLASASRFGQILMKDPEVSGCAGVKKMIQSIPPKMLTTKTGEPDYRFIGIMFGNSPASIWGCAGSQVEEAERLLKK